MRELLFYRHYFHDFFKEQLEKVQEKIDYALFLVTHAQRIPEKFLKHLEGTKGLYELRIEVGKSIFRIFTALIRADWLFFLMDFKRKVGRHPGRNWTSP